VSHRGFFYDTWAFVALANTADPHHALAAEVDGWLEHAGYVAVTSDYVFDETMTGLHLAGGSRVALRFADLLLARIAAEELMLLEVTAARWEKALEVFRRLSPEVPRLSFTDCTSFALMQELDLRLAFTADRHFHRAGRGIRPLLEERGRRVVFQRPE
jgi:hypothetical protein